MKVLVVEDETLIATVLQRELSRIGFDVTVCGTGAEAQRLAVTGNPDVMLLDLTLPDMNGMDVARKLRMTSDVPIIMVTARSQETERIAGLEIGADDYIVKPFSVPELIARMRAVRRRFVATAQTGGVLLFRDLELDLDRYRATRAGVELDLTHKEFEVLRMLMVRPGTIVRRADLIQSVWGLAPGDGANTLDVHVSVLRRKLGDPAKAPVYIETIRSVGFRLIEA